MNPAFDLLITGAHLATMAGASPYGAIRDGAIGIVGKTITWVGAERELPRDASAHRMFHAHGAWATPGLIDCHTHLVYAGNRIDEFEARQNGATYDNLWKAAIKAHPDGVTITSFNEWGEGTQIEPAAARRGYSAYDGAWGLLGTAAQRAYLTRTAYWSGRLHSSG